MGIVDTVVGSASASASASGVSVSVPAFEKKKKNKKKKQAAAAARDAADAAELDPYRNQAINKWDATIDDQDWMPDSLDEQEVFDLWCQFDCDWGAVRALLGY